ncbi:PQQ-dependent sugar dehydrogenase [Tessaracoccus terricola]
MADGLHHPWSLVFVDGQPLFTQRNEATISTLVDGRVVTVAEVPQADPYNEGGLLGLAHSPAMPDRLFAYYTASNDNRVVSFQLSRDGNSFALTDQTPILTGIPKATNHNGGRIAFGPDGYLYVATGDAGEPSRAQDLGSLGGKILRVDPDDGSAAPGNPFGTRVWSYGHRNVQGLAWADDGTMWASELGQSDWDELNIITPGANYGWPVVEGLADDPDYVNPEVVWTPDQASPSGLLWLDDNLYLAALRGEQLWVMLDEDPAGTRTATLTNGPGRIRDVVAAPDGSIWVLTTNGGDDRIIRYSLREG